MVANAIILSRYDLSLKSKDVNLVDLTLHDVSGSVLSKQDFMEQRCILFVDKDGKVLVMKKKAYQLSGHIYDSMEHMAADPLIQDMAIDNRIPMIKPMENVDAESDS